VKWWLCFKYLIEMHENGKQIPKKVVEMHVQDSLLSDGFLILDV
jgi:hypothetical protein